MTPAEFKAAYPAFADATVPDVQRLLSAAGRRFNVGRWAEDYAEGVACYVAHCLYREAHDKPGKIGADNALTKTVGSVTVSRSAQRLEAEADDWFQTTPWGRRYRYLANRVGVGAVMAI